MTGGMVGKGGCRVRGWVRAELRVSSTVTISLV